MRKIFWNIALLLITQSIASATAQKSDNKYLHFLILKNMNEYCWMADSNTVKSAELLGESVFVDIDPSKYINRSIGYLFEDLEAKYKRIYSHINRERNFLGMITRDDNFFYFYFKMNDSTLLNLNCCIPESVKLPSNDNLALEELLKQKQYRMVFRQLDAKKYLKAYKTMISDPSNQKKLIEDCTELYESLKKEFPNIKLE